MKRIGFIGLGTMGKGMVRNLLKKFKVVAYNRTNEKAEDIQDPEFSLVSSPGELPDSCSIIFTCVSNDEALEEVLFKGGVIPKLNNRHVLVDAGTTSIEMTQRIQREARERGFTFFDAPVTGSKHGAASGNLLFMVGGNKVLLEKYREFFEPMAKKIVYCGENTLGQKTKISLNLTQALILESYFEGVLLGLKNGVPLQVIRDVLDSSGARTTISDVKMPYVERRGFEQHFKLELMAKDLRLAEKEMKKHGIMLPLSSHILEVYEQAIKKGLGQEDFIATVKVLEEQVGEKIGQ